MSQQDKDKLLKLGCYFQMEVFGHKKGNQANKTTPVVKNNKQIKCFDKELFFLNDLLVNI